MYYKPFKFEDWQDQTPDFVAVH